MAALTVGSEQQFATLADAVAASHDGDTLYVQAGTYVNDFAVVTSHPWNASRWESLISGRAGDVFVFQADAVAASPYELSFSRATCAHSSVTLK